MIQTKQLPSKLDTNTNNCGHDHTKIIKLAQRKAITKQLAHSLNDYCKLPSYERMSRCGDTLLKQDDLIVSRFYCQNRLCAICNTHRSQRFYHQYKDQIVPNKSWYMVTLTVPNVTNTNLRSTILSMKATFRSILDTANKRHRRISGKTYFNGIMATECTYNAEADTYHPHFHIMVSGKECADHLLFSWLDKHPSATIDAQKVKRITTTDASLRELFKYSIKGADSKTPPSAVHNMAQAFHKLRSIQPFGDIKAKKIDEADQCQDIPDKPIFDATKPFTVYRWYFTNWYDINGKGIIPDDRMQFSDKTINTLSSMINTKLRLIRHPSKVEHIR